MKIFYANKTVYIDHSLTSHKIDLDRELSEQEVVDILQSQLLAEIVEQLIKK